MPDVTCPICGEAVRSDRARFCGRCGAVVRGASVPPPAAAAHAEPPRPSRTRWGAVAVALALVASTIAAAALVAVGRGGSAGAAVLVRGDAARSGRFDSPPVGALGRCSGSGDSTGTVLP